MFKTISITAVNVLDQAEALEFYVGKLGLEVRDDYDFGHMRWLTVGVPGDPDHNLLLNRPGPPMHSEEVAEQVRDLVTKGAIFGFILTTDDCRRTYEELKARGVELTQEPVEQPYGIDCAVRDPFGNHIRITQRADEVGEFTDAVKDRWRSELSS
jgi:catechol 2,3-dioxygenase-like lactoylglutathione lyase family enzyme